MFSMFVVKPVGSNIFLLKVTEGFAVLYHHQTRKLLLSLHWSLSQCSSAEPQLCSRTEGKAQLLPWKDTASQKHSVSSGQFRVMRLAVPLAVPVPWRGLAGFYTCWVSTILQGAGRWEMKSQRNLSHCNLVLVLVREEGVYFLPLHPSHLEGTGGWREELSKKQRANYWKQKLEMHEKTRMKGIN